MTHQVSRLLSSSTASFAGFLMFAQLQHGKQELALHIGPPGSHKRGYHKPPIQCSIPSSIPLYHCVHFSQLMIVF